MGSDVRSVHTHISLVDSDDEQDGEPSASNQRQCVRDTKRKKKRPTMYAFYFGFEDEHVNAMLADIRKNDVTGQPATATTSRYKLVVATPKPRKIASPTIVNIQGWLPGLKADGDSSRLPTIAIAASYDTFEAAPALSVGSGSSGSGVVAILEIAILFLCLYSNPKPRGWYNLLFALISGDLITTMAKSCHRIATIS